MKNHGIEFSLSALILPGEADGLRWTADFNAAHNTNELVSINPYAGSAQQILTGGVSGGVGTLIQVLQPVSVAAASTVAIRRFRAPRVMPSPCNTTRIRSDQRSYVFDS